MKRLTQTKAKAKKPPKSRKRWSKGKRWSERLHGPKPTPIPRKKRTKYSKEALAKAVAVFESKKMSLRECQELFEVPMMTIHRHSKQEWGSVGRPTILSREVEQLLADGVVCLASWGFGVGKSTVISIAEHYLTEIKQPRDLSRSWFEGFIERFKDQLAVRKCSKLASNRAKAVSQECIDDFFQLVKEHYDKHELHFKPHSIWNCDEAGYNCDLEEESIVCNKGVYNPPVLQSKKFLIVNLVKNLTFLTIKKKLISKRRK